MVAQPRGNVTFLFSDIEGSTRLLHELGPEGYREALTEHRRVMRAAFARHGGYEVDYEGDAFFVAFQDAASAVAAAREGQAVLAGGPIRVRMGLHTGTPLVDPPKYIGVDVHLAARVMSVGHGGQVLLTAATREAVEPSGSLSFGELGEHRLKDIEDPVPLFQLGGERFPPLKTISNTNLPRPASSFVGREAEIADVVALVRGGARFVTLTGPAGSGKTRLAIESATELVPELRAGVYWVDLSTLRDPDMVAPAIAQTLGARTELASHIRGRELMLVLDNLEQVAAAAPGLAGLVNECRNLRLLVTSRELLRVRAEVEYAVPSLTNSEAVELFCARSSLDADDEISELCRRLDNLPLAVELAAARVSVLTPGQILTRLSQRLDLLEGGRDVGARQQTLRAAIEWSHDLLARSEQQLFARLGVFVGGCTLEAAEDVAGAELDILQALVEKNLVRHTGDRFSMLETIGEFAAEHLFTSGDEDRLRRRHALWFVRLAEESDDDIWSSQQGDKLDRLEQDHDNLRAVLRWLRANGELSLRLHLAATLGTFWRLRGHLREGATVLESALAEGRERSHARAKALCRAATLARLRGEHEWARELAEEGQSLSRELGYPEGIAASLDELACFAQEQGRDAQAEMLWRELWEVAQAHGLKPYAAASVVDRASLAVDAGRLDDADALGREALGLFEELGIEAGIGRALLTLGRASLASGDIAAAADFVSQALRHYSELGAKEPMISCLEALADVAVRTGETQRGERLARVTVALRDELGAAPGTPGAGNGGGGEAEMTLEEAVDYALSVDSRS